MLPAMNIQTGSTRIRPLLLLAALVIAATLPVSTVLADKSDHIEARELLQRGEIVPLAQILEVVAQRVPGDVIEVELERSEEHTSELQSLMRNSYAVFCLKKKMKNKHILN